METRGRKAYNDRPVKWTVSFPQSLATQIEELLTDSLTGKVHHGARSRLITRLLREWLKETAEVQLLIKGEEHAAIRTLEAGRPSSDRTHQPDEYENPPE